MSRALLLVVAGAPALLGAQELPTADQLANRARGKVIYRDVTVVSPHDAVARPGMAIVVEGERIAAVVPSEQLTPAHRAGATTWEGQGAFVLPGLMDAHVHLATVPDKRSAERELRRLVYSGVTMARDMAGDVRSLADLARAASIHEIPAPDLFYSSLVAGPSFFTDPRPAASAAGLVPGDVPWMQALTPQTDLALAVAQARGTWATGLKIYANLDGALVERTIAEAKRQGMPVWTHLQVYPATPYHSSGATAVSHIAMLARWVLEPGKQSYGHANHPPCDALRADHPEIRKYLSALAASGTVLDATLSLETLPRPGAGARCPGSLIGEMVAAAQRAGVRIAAGTDRTTPPDSAWPALHDEIEALVQFGGLTTMQAIAAATIHGARTVGRERDAGTIEVGKLASLAFVRDDPLTDIRALRTVVLTVKRGVPYPRAEFRRTP